MADQIDSANVNAITAPWNGLYINQYIQIVASRADTGMSEDQIFAQVPTAYETWKIDKEYKDLMVAGKYLKDSLCEMEKSSGPPPAIRSASARDRARRLRSRGYGTSLGEVISADEDWPEEGWADNQVDLLFDSYEARIEAKMRNRPFILDNDPTDCSGIPSRQALNKLEGS
ncbi:hypothetical protein ACHAQJ_006803 [Trichoderma viride]